MTNYIQHKMSDRLNRLSKDEINELRLGSSQARTWMFTYFPQKDPLNTDDQDALYLPFDATIPPCTYFVGQWELTKDQKPHFHGFMKFDKIMTTNQVRDYLRYPGEPLLDMPYLVPARSNEGSIAYVTKSESRIQGTEVEEYGKRPGLKGTTDGYMQARDMAKAGANIFQIEEEFPMVFRQNMAQLRQLCNNHELQRDLKERPTVYIFWGATSAGKTQLAKKMWPGAFYKNNSKWWDGYKQEKVVVWNEFMPKNDKFSDYTLEDMLCILDAVPFSIQYKGGTMQLLADTFIFTTNLNPIDMYKGSDSEQIKAFHSRINHIWYFPKKFNKKMMTEPYYIKQELAKVGKVTQTEDELETMYNDWGQKKRPRDELFDNPPTEDQRKLKPYFS